MKLLHIDSSITGQGSVSRQLSAAIVDALVQADPSTTVVSRDLDADPIPHLDSRSLGSIRPVGDLAPDQETARSAAILDEFLGADVVVIGAPMYNFNIPSQLKAWIDRVLVAGKTFRYTESGPMGLAGGKRVIVASSRGGLYSPGTAQAALDFQEAYLRAVFGFIGITEVEFVRAEGVAFGPEHRASAIKRALGAIPVTVENLVAEAA